MIDVIVATAFDQTQGVQLSKNGYKSFNLPNATVVLWCKEDLQVVSLKDWLDKCQQAIFTYNAPQIYVWCPCGKATNWWLGYETDEFVLRIEPCGCGNVFHAFIIDGNVRVFVKIAGGYKMVEINMVGIDEYKAKAGM